MHLVYCIPSLHAAAGMERIITAKANYLVRIYGYKVSIITTEMYGRKPAFALDDRIQVYDLDVDYSGVNRMNAIKKHFAKRKMRVLHQRRMEELLMQLKADIVVSTFMEEAAFLPKIKDGSKKVLELHFCKGYKNLVAKMNHYPWTAVLSNYVRSWIEEHIYMPRFDKFVCLTEEDMNRWGGKSDKKCYIYNMLPWIPEQTANLENKTVIAVGRLDAQKGFDRLINIWAKLVKIYPDWILNIFGEGVERGSLETQIKNNKLADVVCLRGNVKNLQEEYLSSSIMVMTSRFEGLPMCMLEAKACGLPVVSYDFLCGPKECVTHERNGFLVAEDDEESFCGYLDSLMKAQDLRRQMGAAQVKDAQRFSQGTIMSQWNSLFNELLEN